MVPSPPLVFHSEFAQKKVGAQHGHPDVAGRIPVQLVLLISAALLLDPGALWISVVHSLSQDMSHVFMVPSQPLHLVGPPATQQKEATMKGRTAAV